ncbi:MAG: TIGR03857 family LLM class F420-dependent oxidoreductase [Deltaproteobacteria bacterium]|nr:TIGR03857 family LLM class F420-dependent oxidoreductase [Deltaproteobacteria bacterium]
MTTVNPELGFYALAGQPESPRDLIEEVRTGEAMGLGTAFLSERYNQKEICTLSGAAGAVTDSIRIATACTNHNTRHPIVTAGYALTMHGMTGGRFVLGIGRGIVPMQKAYGIPPITTAQMEDFVGVTRKLLAGEPVMGHDGPIGSYPFLHLGPNVIDEVPLMLVAFGPNSLALGGRVFDEVVLHTYFSDETTERAVKTVKQAAEQAGRNPDDVKVWSCFATIGDHIPEDKRLMKSVGRLATYLQGYGDLLVNTNGWDKAILERFRADEVVSTFQGGIDVKATTEQLEHIASLIPDEWLSYSATGSPDQCVASIRHQMDLGCDGVILHGATPTELAPIVEAYRK